MKVLSAEDSRAWIKGRNAKHPGDIARTDRIMAVSPLDSKRRTAFAFRLSEAASWKGGALVLDRPIELRAGKIEELCRLREGYGFPTEPREIQQGEAPGHLLDDDEVENQQNVARLLTIMLTGHLEGTLSTKSGRLVVVIGDGIVEFYCRDKSAGGKLRGLLKDLKLETFECDHR